MIVKSALIVMIGTVGMLAAAAQADVASEIATATDHAGFAVASQNIGGIRMHLRHAVNCLVGPGAKDFNTSEVNPCEKLGNGAIPDTTSTTVKGKLEAAVVAAQAGIAAKDMGAAKKSASDVYAALRAIK